MTKPPFDDLSETIENFGSSPNVYIESFRHTIRSFGFFSSYKISASHDESTHGCDNNPPLYTVRQISYII